MKLSDNIASTSGVGDKTASLFNRLGIRTINDLIHHYPRRYDDFSNITKIGDIKPGAVTLKVKVKSVGARYTKRGLHITEALVSDRTGDIKLTWFNQPYRVNALKKDKSYYVSGIYEFKGDRYSLTNPAMELLSVFPKNTARIIPIYAETKGLKSFTIRRVIKSIMPLIARYQETLPDIVLSKAELISLNEALSNIHFPKDSIILEAARNRLAFEELYGLILAGMLNKAANDSQIAQRIKFDEIKAKKFVSSLKFDLTDAQRKAAWSVLQDLTKIQPMNRLIQGDVGSGKTVIAMMATIMAANSKLQTAYMAPTEILARQQYEILSQSLGIHGIKSEIFIGAMTAKEKRLVNSRIERGEVDLVIGTHALIQDHPVFKNLSLVIIDEQHRFGVNQRKKLMGKAKTVPHVLTMTATPIPRSLALTVFGELDISVVDELPPGRQSVITKVFNSGARPQLYREVDKLIVEGRQAYVIAPLVDPSDTLGTTSVKEEFNRLNNGPFKHRKIGLLHGKLKPDDKQNIMNDFINKKIDILVSTTVVEVGVNVPNATAMIIEGAERFGLAQLHQLRGRIRRGTHKPYCYLIPSPGQDPPKRLNLLETTDDGFKLADYDLNSRGPGQIYGSMQHGQLDLKLANLTDVKLIAKARNLAKFTLENKIDLLQYPQLHSKVKQLRKVTNLN